MLQRAFMVATFCLIATLFQPLAPAHAAPTQTTAVNPDDAFAYFPETGHNITPKVKKFYDSHGGLEVFGMPLTEVFVEDGTQVQYFERARFELSPNSSISLTRLGAHFSQGRKEPEFQWLVASPTPDRTFYPQSGHTLGGAFGWYWQTHGGVATFGYPVSEELNEINPSDGKKYLVQYFERARFEYHPEGAATHQEVQLSQLGRQFLNERPAAQAMTAPAKQVQLLGKATTGYATSFSERIYNIARATQMFDGVIVQPGQEYSFLNSGDFSENAGFVDGYAIVGGRLEKVLAGGLCQVSTTMFRAASNAGMQITRREGHTYVVNFYENILGFDATVFSPGVDFRWRNDYPGPVYMAASTNPDAATVTFQFWGTSDGRTTTYEGPFVKNKVYPSAPVWQYDSTVSGVRQIVHGRPGMDVDYIRTVTMPDGTVKHHDDFFTHYDPWNDYYLYGPGASPR